MPLSKMCIRDRGENSFSVLQMANATAALSKKGLRYAPTLIKSIDGQEQQKRILSQPFLSDSTYAAISQGMQRVVQSGGTAAGAFAGLPIGVAAKTGTAEADGKDNYGWFIAVSYTHLLPHPQQERSAPDPPISGR